MLVSAVSPFRIASLSSVSVGRSGLALTQAGKRSVRPVLFVYATGQKKPQVCASHVLTRLTKPLFMRQIADQIKLGIEGVVGTLQACSKSP